MKKLFLLIAVVAMILPSCKKINETLESLDNRVTELENTTIPTINEQIAKINTSIVDLEEADVELKNYITALQGTAAELQKSIDATNVKIDEINVTLQSEISTAKAEVLAQLEALRTEMNNELAQISSTIAILQAKDVEIEQKIADLKSYVDNELKNTEDWATATFSTLEQYNAVCAEIATIKTQIENLNKSISELETRLNAKIATDIASAVKGLQSELADVVTEITNSYTSAISTAKEEITAAYTVAIQSAISALESSMKQWVGEQLANYYTIAQVDAKILALQTTITDGDAALLKELNKLKSQLETTTTEITAAYKKAIEEAISTNNGVINTKIANEITSVNQRISKEVATVNAKIAELQVQVDKNTADIANLLARIQSVSYIPTYSDGKATVKYNGGVSQVTLDFKFSPKECVAELEKVWKEVLKVEAVYTQTRVVSFMELQIVKCEVDTITGVVSIIASCSNLSTEFFAGTQEASAALVISDGNNSITSEYVPMTAKEVSDEELEDDILSSIPKNQIWYTTNDDSKLFPNTTDVTTFGAILTSNTYKNGKGILTFDDNVTKIGAEAFKDCDSLTSITIPDGVTSIGSSAFYECRKLTSVTIPDSVTTIGSSAFYDCSSLTSITIPDSVTWIGSRAFYDCNSLDSVHISDLSAWCRIRFDYYNYYAQANPLCNGAHLYLNETLVEDLVIPNNVTSIEPFAFDNCKSIKSVTIPDSVTSIRSRAFSSCPSLTSVTIGNSVTSIGDYAFSDCTSLTSITIPDSVTEIGDHAFYNCNSLTSITIPDSVTRIRASAFCSCDSLTSVTIGNGITAIGKDAFYGCSKLQYVYCKALTPPSLECYRDYDYDYEGGLTYFGPFDLLHEEDFVIYIPARSFAIYYQYTNQTIGSSQDNWSLYKSYLVPYNFQE